jgi:hypothetical protein
MQLEAKWEGERARCRRALIRLSGCSMGVWLLVGGGGAALPFGWS